MELAKIIQEIHRIRVLGFVPNTATEKNIDGAIGRTFEDLLGVQENNLRDPDFLGFEVKTQRQLTKSAISLFTRAPNNPNRAMRLLRDTFGDYRDERFPAKKKLFASIFANRWGDVYEINKMKLDINSSERRIELLIKRNHDLFEIPVYWNFDDIENGIQKIDKLMVIKSDVKETDSNRYFKFTECRVYLQVEMEKFLKALTDGFIQFDIRLGIYKSGENEGKYHNHGGGFRIKSRDLYRLYRNVTTV